MRLRSSWATRDSVSPSEGERNLHKSGETYFGCLCDHIYWSVGENSKCHLLKKLYVGNLLTSTVEYSSDYFLAPKCLHFKSQLAVQFCFPHRVAFLFHTSRRDNWSTTNLLDGSCVVVRLWAVRKHEACLKSPLCLGKMLDKAWKIAQ